MPKAGVFHSDLPGIGVASINSCIAPWFTRTYFLDPYSTTIDGRPCRNRMTVGDEIESGKGNLLLSTYKHEGGTAYRAGDLYAEILLGCIRKLQEREPEAMRRAMEKLGIDPAEDPSSWYWDNYWRLFCVIEGALERSVPEGEVGNIGPLFENIRTGDLESHLCSLEFHTWVDAERVVAWKEIRVTERSHGAYWFEAEILEDEGIFWIETTTTANGLS